MMSRVWMAECSILYTKKKLQYYILHISLSISKVKDTLEENFLFQRVTLLENVCL